MKLGVWGGPSTHWPQQMGCGDGKPSWKCGWSRNEEALPADGFSGGCCEFLNMGKTENPNRLLLSKPRWADIQGSLLAWIAREVTAIPVGSVSWDLARMDAE